MHCAAIRMLSICLGLFICKGTWYFVAVLTSAALNDASRCCPPLPQLPWRLPPNGCCCCCWLHDEGL
jgi:hypothetical protein